MDDLDNRLLRSHLAAGTEKAPEGILEAVLDEIHRRPRSAFPPIALRRVVHGIQWWDFSLDRLRIGVGLLVLIGLLLAVVAAIALVGGPRRPLMSGFLAAAVGGEAWLVDPAVGEASVLVATPDLEEVDVAWSPDGAVLAATSRRQDGTWRLDLIDPHALTRRIVAEGFASLRRGVAWTADGGAIVVGGRLDGDDGLIFLGLAGASPRLLVAHPGAAWPAVSPDGRLVAFIVTEAGTDELWLAATGDGAITRRVSLRDIGGTVHASPTWGGDGTVILAVDLTSPEASVVVRVRVRDGDTQVVNGEWASAGGRARAVELTTGLVVTTSGTTYLDAARAPIAVTRTAGGTGAPIAMVASPSGARIATLRSAGCGSTRCTIAVQTLSADDTAPTGRQVRVASLPRPPDGEFGASLSWQPLHYPVESVAVHVDETCVTIDQGRMTRVGEVERWEDVTLRCTDRATDARLGGETILRFRLDISPDQSATMAGTATLTNDEGSWIGTFRGTIAPGYTTHQAASEWNGRGAYDGLHARLSVRGDPAAGYSIEAVVEPSR
jgi:dipeptidyl aminopeptidase/acylaminoacyl peptidase